MKKVIYIVMLCVAMVIVLAGCDADSEADYLKTQVDMPLHVSTYEKVASPDWVKELDQAKNPDNKQLFVVAGMGMDKTTAYISMHEKDESGEWMQTLTTPGYVGKNGMCLEKDHKKGSMKTPIGEYHFTRAFGINPNPGSNYPYVRVMRAIYWSGDPDNRYNQMANIKEYPELDTELSKRFFDYEYTYQFCMNISFNEEGDPDKDFAIFLHCLDPERPYTDGGVAIPEDMMRRIIHKNVREDCVVIIDTMDNLGATFD